jgi:hypothetical protein
MALGLLHLWILMKVTDTHSPLGKKTTHTSYIIYINSQQENMITLILQQMGI